MLEGGGDSPILSHFRSYISLCIVFYSHTPVSVTPWFLRPMWDCHICLLFGWAERNNFSLQKSSHLYTPLCHLEGKITFYPKSNVLCIAGIHFMPAPQKLKPLFIVSTKLIPSNSPPLEKCEVCLTDWLEFWLKQYWIMYVCNVDRLQFSSVSRQTLPSANWNGNLPMDEDMNRRF